MSENYDQREAQHTVNKMKAAYNTTGMTVNLHEQGSVSDIYDVLLEGKRLRMTFGSAAKAEAFRVSLFAYRKKVADTLIALGEPTEKESKQLIFRTRVSPTNTDVTAVVYLEDKPDVVRFQYEIIG